MSNLMNFNQEFSRLLTYISDVSSAIRLNSPYRAGPAGYADFPPEEIGNNVMWLADSLHKLHILGEAIGSGDSKRIVDTCDTLMAYYRLFFVDEMTPGTSFRGGSNPKVVMERFSTMFKVQTALQIFADIRNKVYADDLLRLMTAIGTK